MNVYQRFATLSLQAHIYRYQIVGGALSFFAVPDFFRYYKYHTTQIRPLVREIGELKRSGQY